MPETTDTEGTGDGTGFFEGLTEWTTRNTNEYVSGTTVDREQAEQTAQDLYGEDYEQVADDYAGLPEDPDAWEGFGGSDWHPDWRDDATEAAESVDETVANPPNPLQFGPAWLDEGTAIVLVIVVLALLAPYADLGNTVLEGT